MLTGRLGIAILGSLICGISFYIPMANSGLLADATTTTGTSDITQIITDTTGIDTTSTMASLDTTTGILDTGNTTELSSLSGLDTFTLRSVTGTVSIAAENTTDPALSTLEPVVGTTTDLTASTTGTVLDTAAPTTNQLTSSIEPIINTVADTTADTTAPLLDATDTVVQPVADTTAPVLEAIAGTTESALNELTYITEPLVDTLSETVTPVTDAITAPLDPVLQTVVDTLDPLSNTVADIASPVTTPLQPITDLLISTEYDTTANGLPENNPGIWPLMFTSELSAADSGESHAKMADNCRDSDLDGVCDVQDECPHTPIGATVLAHGCGLENDKPLQLAGVYFAFDSAVLTSDSIQYLKKALDIIRESNASKIEIGGHADAIGTEPYNDRLSRARAGAVFTYLVSNGVDASRLVVQGYGENRPVADNSTEQNRAMNRRVEFSVVEGANSALQTARLD